MTDAKLIEFLGLKSEPMAEEMVRAFTPELRASYERMAEVSGLLNQGIVPAGVMVDPRRRR